MSFNAGDKVICVDDNVARSLTQGKIYTVVSLWNDGTKNHCLTAWPSPRNVIGEAHCCTPP